LSAQYRTPHLDHTKVLDYWLERLGPSKLLWGSDWPHTGFERDQGYAQQLNALGTLVHDEQLLDQILSTNPKYLYW
jgi:predicted TIM-barrel fold metal-dependent hydrolase